MACPFPTDSTCSPCDTFRAHPSVSRERMEIGRCSSRFVAGAGAHPVLPRNSVGDCPPQPPVVRELGYIQLFDAPFRSLNSGGFPSSIDVPHPSAAAMIPATPTPSKRAPMSDRLDL